MNEQTFGLDPLNYLLDGNFLPDHVATAYADLVQELCEIYVSLSEDVAEIRIHGDAHGGNLLRGAEGWFFLDFDDFVNGPPVQDIWLLAGQQGLEGMRNRSILLEGYRQFREFPDSWLSLVEPLRALRFVHYSSWIARRFEDPAFPAAFPHFGSEEYWENELHDLQEQLRIIKEGATETEHQQENESAAEQEMTNKDFFWDWED